MTWLLAIGSFYSGLFFGIMLASVLQAAKDDLE